MENKNSKDAFASMSLGGSDKYVKRHQEAVRLERANELDKRIAEFNAKKHDLDWAEKAGDFCDREAENGKDLEDVSKGFKELARIRKEAESILKAEAKRKADEEKKKEMDALQELADEFDENVNNFVSKPHNVEWANVAVEFCDREKVAGKEFAQLSKTYKSLDNIKKEAKDILKVEDARIKAEKEELKLKKQELELKQKQEEDAIVKDISEQILNLSIAERTKEWLMNVEKVSLIMKGLPTKVQERVANRFFIYSFQNESQIVKKAFEFDDQVLILNAVKLKSKNWAKNVFDLESKIKDEKEYMKHVLELSQLSFEARQVYFSDEFESLKSFMKKVEEKDFSNVEKEIKENEKISEKLSKELAIDDYVEDFEKRWNKTKKDVDAFLEKMKKEEEERQAEIKRKEEQEKTEKLRIEREKEEREARKKKKKKRIINSLTIFLEIAVLASIVTVGVLFFSKPLGLWTLSIGGACALTYFWLKFTHFFTGKKMGIALLYVIGSLVIGLNVVSLFVPVLDLYFMPLLVSVIVVSIVRIRKSLNYFVVCVIFVVALSFVLSNKFGLTAIYPCAGIIVIGAIALSIVTWKNYTYEGANDYKKKVGKLYGSFIGSLLLSIFAVVLMIVFRTSAVETWVASCVGSALLVYFWILYAHQFTLDRESRYIPLIIIVSALCVLNIVGFFLKSGACFVPLLVSAMTISLIDGIVGVREEEESLIEYSFFAICLSFLTGAGAVAKYIWPILGDVYTSLIVAGVMILMSVAVSVLFKIYDACDVGKAFFVFPLLLNIFAGVIGWWFNWGFVILGTGAIVSSILMESFYAQLNDGYDDFGWLEWGTTFLGGVSLFIALCFTF